MDKKQVFSLRSHKITIGDLPDRLIDVNILYGSMAQLCYKYGSDFLDYLQRWNDLALYAAERTDLSNKGWFRICAKSAI